MRCIREQPVNRTISPFIHNVKGRFSDHQSSSFPFAFSQPPRIIDLYYILPYAISPNVDTDSDFNKIESVDRIEYVAMRLSDFTEKEQEEIRSGLSVRPLWRLPP